MPTMKKQDVPHIYWIKLRKQNDNICRCFSSYKTKLLFLIYKISTLSQMFFMLKFFHHIFRERLKTIMYKIWIFVSQKTESHWNCLKVLSCLNLLSGLQICCLDRFICMHNIRCNHQHLFFNNWLFIIWMLMTLY